MGYWSIYFLAKVGLFYKDFIGFHWQLNLVFAVVLLMPLSKAKLQLIRKILSLPIGICLLYYDSWLPPISRFFAQTDKLTGFDAAYLLELMGRFVNLWLLAALAILLITFIFLRRRLRFSSLAIVGILSIPFLSLLGGLANGLQSNYAQTAQQDTKFLAGQQPSAYLKSFYEAEGRKHVSFPSIVNSKAPFDVIFLHVCSLSWDDMDYVGEGKVPLLNRFDVVFRHFNSAASYSGPATLRLFHSNCGQPPHKGLYDNNSPRCNLFHNFKEAGYEVRGMLNHDGHFDQFSAMIQGANGINNKLEENQFAPIAMHSFDDTPIYEDLPLLSKWWSQQAASNKPKVLYYNTITLHDGNRLANLTSRSSLETFKPRVHKLMSDFDQFITLLERAGKPVVVVLLPEHGAALRGDKMQISGMREIPNPNITLVPAAIKLVGFKAKFNHAPNQPLLVNKPISYFALSTLLANFMADSPFTDDGGQPLTERLQNIPSTSFVSENNDIVVMGQGNDYLMGSQDATWVNYQPKP
jgi:cellulose synthase operon protein YhjU